MTDIVKRLREGVFGGDETKTDVVIHSHMQAGADEIERLLAERDRLQAGLLRALQYENKCDQTGKPCRSPDRCACSLEAETWCDGDGT
jgi:hypothetical protein